MRNVNVINDRARQNIIKKRYFPKNIIGYTKKAERVNFAKKGSEDKVEIVFSISFLIDLEEQEMKREINGEIFDFSHVDQKVHLPKRFQALFAKMYDLSKLEGTLLVRPDYDAAKWRDKTDESKSSIPFIMITPSARTLKELSIEKEDYPDFSAWKKEIQRVNSAEDGDGEFAGAFATLINRLTNDSKAFYNQETDSTNQLV